MTATPLRIAHPGRVSCCQARELRRVARHEAGHAVMAIALGCQVRDVIVHASGDGCVRVNPRREDPLVVALIAWAGPIAEGLTPYIGEEDLSRMLAARLRPTSIATARRWAEETFALRNLGPAVAAVAELLRTRVGRRVPGTAIRRTLAKAAPWVLVAPRARIVYAGGYAAIVSEPSQ